MISLLWLGVSSALSFVFGYFVSAYLIAKDKDVVRLHSDEIIVKKPAEGLVLVAVTQQVARRIVLERSGLDKKISLEARDMF